MNKKWFGDSFDIVKRYFIENLREIGYDVVYDSTMLSGEWDELEQKFYLFLGVSPISETKNIKSALLLDPDTGIGRKKTKKHITIDMVTSYLQNHEVVFTFDQSFSIANSADNKIKMKEKLGLLKEKGKFGLYYNSHAKFLFAANSLEHLNAVEQRLLSSGLPRCRLLKI